MPWCASIRVDGALVDLGRFASEAAAALAYDFRARHLGRPLNFPSGNFLSFAQHTPMPAAVHPAEGDDALMAGGVNVGGQLPVHTKRASRQRGGDTSPECHGAAGPARMQPALGFRRAKDAAAVGNAHTALAPKMAWGVCYSN